MIAFPDFKSVWLWFKSGVVITSISGHGSYYGSSVSVDNLYCRCFSASTMTPSMSRWKSWKS